MQVEKIEYNDYTQIHYYNDGMGYRILVLDNNSNVIQDEISEYDQNGKHIADIVFGADHTTIISMRKYTEDGFEDYRRVGSELVLVQYKKNHWITPNQKLKSEFYNAKDELVFYNIFEKDEDESIGMVSTGNFDANNVVFGWDNPPHQVKILQSYSDY